MACFFPVRGWPGPGGKLTQNRRLALSPLEKVVPCLGCIGCRVDKTSEWATRAVLELRSHAESSFLTLTYNDEHLPKNSTLNPKHLADFWKRLRIFETRRARALGVAPPVIRYLSCGEYGEKYLRPHYHAVVYGYCPPDGKVLKKTDFGPLYSSEILDSIWTHGFTSFGSVQFESCAYVSSYVQKKITGKKADEVYNDRFAPFARMSTKPGLGLEAAYSLQHEWSDDKIFLSPGRSAPIPRYLLDYIRVSNPQLWQAVHEQRTRTTPARLANETPERLHARHQVMIGRLNQTHKENYHAADFSV